MSSNKARKKALTQREPGRRIPVRRMPAGDLLPRALGFPRIPRESIEALLQARKEDEERTP